MTRGLAALLALGVLLGGCGDPSASRDPWVVEVVHEASTKVGGVAIGDADPDRPGLEIVAVDLRGDVHLLYRNGDAWGHETIARTGGEKIQCAVGRLGGPFAGLTVAVVGVAEGTEDDGGAGAVVLVGRGQDGWRSEKLAHPFPTLVHGVAIHDVDPGAPGDELLVTGFDRKLAIFRATGDDGFASVELALKGPGKAVAAWPGGAAVAEATSALEWVEGGGASYELGTRRIEASGLARIAALDRGAGLLVAGDDGRLRLFRREEGGYGADEVLHEEPQKLRGAAVGDFDPTHAGPEFATAGYEGRVTVLAPEPRVVYQDAAKLHHLAAGDLLPEVPGDELVTSGYSGRIVLIRRR